MINIEVIEEIPWQYYLPVLVRETQGTGYAQTGGGLSSLSCSVSCLIMYSYSIARTNSLPFCSHSSVKRRVLNALGFEKAEHKNLHRLERRALSPVSTFWTFSSNLKTQEVTTVHTSFHFLILFFLFFASRNLPDCFQHFFLPHSVYSSRETHIPMGYHRLTKGVREKLPQKASFSFSSMSSNPPFVLL